MGLFISAANLLDHAITKIEHEGPARWFRFRSDAPDQLCLAMRLTEQMEVLHIYDAMEKFTLQLEIQEAVYRMNFVHDPSRPRRRGLERFRQRLR
jgi:hypothetical protein